ncbi:MAG TPA: amidohydrolase family protein [Chthonomonadales bacterium]|nr:amidohydrolase family protein [Chthonomonadales bacterium]
MRPTTRKQATEAAKTVQLAGGRPVAAEGAAAQDVSIACGRIRFTGHADVRLDVREHLIFPGLVNAHDHLHRNAIPVFPHSRPFANSYCWAEAFQAHFENPAVIAVRALPTELLYRHGGLKNMLSGVTAVAHHDPWNPALNDRYFPVRLLRRYGWCHSLELGQERPGKRRFGPDVRESFAATPKATAWIIHLAEGADEVAGAELETLAAMGCLAENTVLVHGVGLSHRDLDRVIEAGAAVVWCPASNLSMLGKTLDPRRLYNSGRLALGTDSRLTGSSDMLEELRVAERHSDLTAAELFRLATTGSARTIRMPRSGALAQAWLADLFLARDRGGCPYSQLLQLRRRDLRAVVRAGTPAIADPDLEVWFRACGIEPLAVILDGAPKLMDPRYAGPAGALALEPGLELGHTVSSQCPQAPAARAVPNGGWNTAQAGHA